MRIGAAPALVYFPTSRQNQKKRRRNGVQSMGEGHHHVELNDQL